MKLETETAGMQPQVQAHMPRIASNHTARKGKGRSSLVPLEKAWPCPHLDFEHLAF